MDDDEDEEIYEDAKEKKEEIPKENTEIEASSVETSIKSVDDQQETTDNVSENKDDKAALECVAKILEETKVPELPSADLIDGIAGIGKKSVKFSSQISKDIAITKMALVQPKSNMAGPMEVDDEFAEAEEPETKSLARKILKRSR